ncbi:hypothetical protein QTJ16_007076 [Diplocarpon rosae]|uniref:DUF302 domain-containing protein n=1 Tax=Diplocarpon rosae TaxID=946125 RepID=A0AAD9W9M5_9HELO|nr:hypothetical protein QTJ16_007076 [Diplocarpon rosae]
MSHLLEAEYSTLTTSRSRCSSEKPFDEVMASLYASIGSPDKASEWLNMAKDILSGQPHPQERFKSAVEAAIGPHGFMIFQEFDHGIWISLFGVGSGLKAKRVILGNPLIALTMLEHDLAAGLFVPVEILVLEKEGGTEIIWNVPSAQISAVNKHAKLLTAAVELDRKLVALVKDILS